MPSYCRLSQQAENSSIAHGIDARAKVTVLIALSVALWGVDTLAGLGLNVLLCLFCLALAGPSAARVLGGLKSLWSIFLLVIIYYLWAESSLGGGLSAEGLPRVLGSSLMLCGKLAVLVAVALWLYFSTPPMQVVDSLTSLLRPLERLKVPVGELGFTVGLVLRMFPSAQGRMRELFGNFRRQGKLADTRNGYGAKFSRNLRAVIDTMVCYMHYSLHEAELLSLSLMARGYNPFRVPAHPGNRPFSPTDWLFCTVSLTVVILTSVYL